MRNFPKPVLVMSACLDLQPVRYNGEPIKDEFTIKLREYCRVVPVCPEISIGLGVPREKVIVYVKENFRIFQPSTGMDLTDEMISFAESFLSSLERVDGFLLKSKSPSCGVSGTRIYKDPYGKQAFARGKGLFALKVLERFEFVPVEDEKRLRNADLRDHFLIRLFAIADLRESLSKVKDVKDLVDFHRRYKYLIMAHSQQKLKEMGRTVANASKSLPDSLQTYQALFLQMLKKRPSKGQHINVLLHIMGHISDKINDTEKRHFFELVENYKRGHETLYTLLEILRTWAYLFGEEYLFDQVYLEPYPKDLRSVIINT